MSERLRRYIPSFKRRRVDGDVHHRSRSNLWDGSDECAECTADGGSRQTDASQDMDVALARMRQLQAQKERELLPQRYRRLRLARRQEPGSEDDPTIVREIIQEDPNGQGPPGVTVTVSIGLSLQISTITSGGSTFVSTMSTSWFTFDASGNVSLPTSTASTTSGPKSSSTPAAFSSSPTSNPASSLSSTSSTSFLTIPAPTPISTGQPVSLASVSDIQSATTSITSASSFINSLAPNMTEYSLAKTRSTTYSAKSITDSTRSSKHSSQHTSTRISTVILTTSTIFPAESEPTTPLDSPSSTIESADSPKATESSGAGSINEKLPPILGGVFGGIAGLGLVLWAILFLLRKRRRSAQGISMLGSGARGRNGHHRAISQDTAGGGSMGEMSQPRSSMMPGFLASGAAGLFGARSSAEATPAPPAEVGFVKIAGRKLPSMYGDDMVPTSLAVASARASVSEPGSRNVSGGTHATAGASGSTKSFIQDDEIMAVPVPFAPSRERSAMRTGSPGLVGRIAEDEPEITTLSHTAPPPAIHDPAEGSSRFPTPPPGAIRRMHSLIGTDGVGRSLASQDGSKTSRFTEDV